MSKAVEAFGKYLLLERLAAGGMAEIYLAKSIGAVGIGKFVAIKRILPQYSDNQEFIDMFKEEAKIVMNLNHSNVVSIYDFGVEKSQFYISMEFVEGQNLRQTLNHLKNAGKYFTIDQIVYIAKETAAGLDHAHRCMDASTGRQLNITHRDMSPQNVMLSFEGEIKIVDFGIAKAETQLEHTRSGTIKGKFGYMSPEQAEGNVVDARTDIFSLGIVLWELLAQERLFTAQSEAATLRKIKDCQIPPIRKLNPSVPPELERIVGKALAKDKTLRYQTAETLTKDLNKFLNMQFPDFTKQEFSKFMKSIYHEMFLENRKKLSEYTKLEAPSKESKNSEGHTVTNTLTSTRTQSQTQNKADDGPAISVDPSLSQKIDLSKLQLSGGNLPGGPILARRTVHGTLNNSLSASAPVRTHSVTNARANNTQSKVMRHNEKKSSGLSIFIISLFLLAFGYWFFIHEKTKPASAPNNVSETAETQEGNANLGSKTNPEGENIAAKDVQINIQTTPQNAMVYIDDKPLGPTPIITHLKEGKIFRIRLIKDGYLPMDYPGEIATNGFSKNVTLIPEPSSGFAIIDAVDENGNKIQSPVVIINDQKVSNTLPFKVKIPAGTPITVKVINIAEKKEGVALIVVGQKQEKAVRIQVDRAAHLNN